MGRRIKALIISLFAALAAAATISVPVFAAPETAPTTTEETTENATETATENTTENTTEAESEDQNEKEQQEEEAKKPVSCYDQVGNLGWIVCPGTSFLGSVMDKAYDVLEEIITLSPIPTEKDSPLRVVWFYFRQLTNICFILTVIFIIISQVTGLGINNYGIKRMLPRLIVTAVLVNLSYYLCALAVDLSNFIGSVLRSFFETIGDYAIAHSKVSAYASSFSMGDTIASVLGLSAAGVGITTAAVVSTSWAGLLYLLIPVVISGALAVISALFTMAARHAAVFLLVMISPLAIICRSMPNLEKWYDKWYKLFAKMLFFYPIFSILYGASNLASLIIITSAESFEFIVIGIAVKVLPLFMTIPLLKMSDTPIGAIDRLIHTGATPISKFTTGFAKQNADLAKEKQLNSRSALPSTHLAQYLAKRRVSRDMDIMELRASNIDYFKTESMKGWYRNGDIRKKVLSNRGFRHYMNEERKFENEIDRTNIASDFEEGFTDKKYSARKNRRLDAINERYGDAVIRNSIAKTRAHEVALHNTDHRADTIREAIRNNDKRITRQINEAFHYKNNVVDGTEQARINAMAKNAVLADAIAAKRKVDNEAKATYLELYDDMPAGMGPTNELIKALDNKDYNSMVAAIQIMAKRGDYNLIMNTLKNHSHKIVGDSSANLIMQKQLSDTMLGMKEGSIWLSTWAKANMMRRAYSAENADNDEEHQVEGFIDFGTFMRGEDMAGDTNQKRTKKVKIGKLLADVNGAGVFTSMDRTAWKQMTEYFIGNDDDGIPSYIETPTDEELEAAGVDMAKKQFDYLAPLKYIRSAMSSGQMDGEKLGTAVGFLTMGFDMEKFNEWAAGNTESKQNSFFESHKQQIHNSLIEFVKNMSSTQLANSKSTTIKTINAALMYINGDAVNDVIDVDGTPRHISDANEGPISQELFEVLANQRALLNKNSAAGTRGGMNPEVKQMLGIISD